MCVCACVCVCVILNKELRAETLAPWCFPSPFSLPPACRVVGGPGSLGERGGGGPGPSLRQRLGSRAEVAGAGCVDRGLGSLAGCLGPCGLRWGDQIAH